MSYASVQTATTFGVDVIPVSVEVDSRPGLPKFRIIGLPDRQIEESKERVRSAIKNSGFEFPATRLTVNLSPSDFPKYGTGFDLAIALSILSAGKMGAFVPESCFVFGELGMDGQLLEFQRLTSLLVGCRKFSEHCLIPRYNQRLYIPGLSVLDACSLKDVVESLLKKKVFKPLRANSTSTTHRTTFTIDDVSGQLSTKRALLISLSGGHNLLLSGPPGAGKTMLAQSACELLPDLLPEERLEVQSIQDLVPCNGLVSDTRPPVQAPHHSATIQAIFGGGASLYPGAVSLAHRGILFLDEFPEFRHDVRESLRQPLQERCVRILRSGRTCVFPADCLVIAAQNDCPCGMLGTPLCKCGMAELLRYQKKISQPILDRFSVFADVAPVSVDALYNAPVELSGAAMSRLIESVRFLQRKRSGGRLNGQLTSTEIPKVIPIVLTLKTLLRRAQAAYGLSARSLNSLLAVSRTIADISGSTEVLEEHVQEALQYRRRAHLQTG